ncbi:MAG: hypothetical protein RL220_1756 [Bacteroidota bacterium]|jgi:putative toxin-antitoxin system antitoxin component (TIGR02293 family)
MSIRTKSGKKNPPVIKGRKKSESENNWILVSDDKTYEWGSQMARVSLVREGIGYGAIETISNRLHCPVKTVLSLMGMPQTTYNKKKSEHSLMDTHSSEWVLLVTELIDYGLEVFNQEEEKWLRWLQKPNLSLGGQTPVSLLDTISGIDEVRSCLNRIEFGNFA